PVFYLDIQKVKRGHYTVSGELLTDSPADLPDGEVTRLYMKRLEQSIKQAPEYWLWSHRRWKKKRDKQPENSAQ
ncbi:MAG: acetyltransferase, partial [Bacteroidales bacterium]|nr:acetyltransferase [Bacteroidales bacterium]